MRRMEISRGIESPSVIQDAQADIVFRVDDFHASLLDLRVAREIRQRFLPDAKQHRLHQRVQPPRRSLHFKVHAQPERTALLLDQESQRGDESQVVELGRPQVMYEAVQSLRHVAAESLQSVHDLLHFWFSQLIVLQGCQFQREGRKRLGSLVVQFPCNSGALILLRTDSVPQ